MNLNNIEISDNKKIKLIFLLKDYSVVGGIQIVTKILSRYFIQNNISVHIISNSIIKEDISGAQYAHLPNKDYGSIENAIFIKKYILKNSITCIINQGILFPFYKELYSPEIKYIAVLHSNLYWQKFSYRESIFHTEKHTIKSIIKKCFYYPFFHYRYIAILKRLYENAIKNNSLYVTLSDSYTSTLIKQFPEYRDKIVTIQNPIKPKLCRIPFNEKENILLYVGRVELGCKRIDRLLKIWKSIEKDTKNWKLLIVGDGLGKQPLIEMARRLKLQNIEFTGYTDPEPYYQRSKIICLTSDFEGLPMVLIEAQYYGVVPVVYNCSNGVKDIVSDNSGILVPLKRHKLYVDSLKRIISDKDYNAELSRNCIFKSKNYDLKIIGDKWLHILK